MLMQETTTVTTTEKLRIAQQRAEKRARAQAARPPNEPALPRESSARTTPHDQRPSASSIGPPLTKLLLSRTDLAALGINYSRAHLHRLMAAGKFPRQLALGPERSARKAWNRRDVEAWLAALPYSDTTKNEETAA